MEQLLDQPCSHRLIMKLTWAFSFSSWNRRSEKAHFAVESWLTCVCQCGSNGSVRFHLTVVRNEWPCTLTNTHTHSTSANTPRKLEASCHCFREPCFFSPSTSCLALGLSPFFRGWLWRIWYRSGCGSKGRVNEILIRCSVALPSPCPSAVSYRLFPFCL